MPRNASKSKIRVYASPDRSSKSSSTIKIKSKSSPNFMTANHHSNTNTSNQNQSPVSQNNANSVDNPYYRSGNTVPEAAFDSTPLDDVMKKVAKIRINRPEIMSLLEFIPLAKDLDASDAYFGYGYNLQNGDFTIDATSAALLLEKQNILRELSNQSVNEFLKYFSGRDIHLLLTQDISRAAIIFDLSNYMHPLTSIELTNDFVNDVVNNTLEGIKNRLISLEETSEIQVEEGQQTDLFGLELLTTGDVNNPNADAVLRLVIEYFVRHIGLYKYLETMVNYYLLKDYTKSIMRMR